MRGSRTTAHHKRRFSRATPCVPHLFDCWEKVSQRLRAAKEIRLFIDFDGTLVPHRADPDSVRLGDEMKAALQRIVSHRHIHVGIMSGRRRANLRRLVRIPKIEFYGLYGYESENGLEISVLTALNLRQILEALEEQSADMPGIQWEDKGVSVAVHFRDAPPMSRQKANRLIRRAVSCSRGDLRVVETDSAWDIVPRRVQGKGSGVRNALKNIKRDFLSVFIGDDISDEPAFKELRGGITVRVGSEPRTEAHYRLDDSEEVREFLDRLERGLP